MKLPLNTDLTGKTVVITGAGGVLGLSLIHISEPTRRS